MSSFEQHLQQIPNAVAIASSQEDPTISRELREQAVVYLNKVKQLGEETWQACLMLYLQGAGASSPNPEDPNSIGRDGKPKLSSQLRVFCLSVVDEVLSNKPGVVSENDLEGLYQAMIGYVRTEFVEGTSEFGAAYMRNKFCATLALVFLRLYPDTKPDFLAPFLTFLSAPQSSQQANKLSATLLTLHTLCEIAAEVHDPLLKSARVHTADRHARDGKIRDHLRNGDANAVFEGCLGIIESGFGGDSGDLVNGGARAESVEWALRTISTWSPWSNINTSITPRSLSVYRSVMRQPILKYGTLAIGIYTNLVSKGSKTPGEKLEVLRVLDVMSFLPELEERSAAHGRGSDRTEEQDTYRESLARLLAVQGIEALKVVDDEAADQETKVAAESIATRTFPHLVKFLGDDRDEVSVAVGPLLNEVLLLYKREKKTVVAGGGGEAFVITEERQAFLATVLETLVSKMQWEPESEWSLGGDEDEDEAEQADVDAFNEKRMRIRADVEAIGVIVPDIMNQKILGFVNSTFDTIAARGHTAVSWQQAELAVHLTYIYGEVRKVGVAGSANKEAYFVIPPDAAEILRIRAKEKADVHRARSKGHLGPGGLPIENPHHEPIDFTSFPLTPQGDVLSRAVTSGLLSYPHSAVVLQMLECAVRYCEFFKNRREYIQPVLAACVDSRGIHNENKSVARRVFYLFAKFVKNSRTAIETSFVAEILGQIGDALPIHARVPVRENPDDDLLMKATIGNQAFDNHLYLYEAVGTLIFLVREPQVQVDMLNTIVVNLVQGIDATSTRLPQQGEAELQRILLVHHHIMAVGALAKGFPDAPDVLPDATPTWVAEFEKGIDAVLRALTIMKEHRIVRDAARNAFSGIVTALSTRVLPFIAPLVVNMAGYFEAQEIVEFCGFLGLLTHKLKHTVFDIMDELTPIVFDRVYVLLGQEVDGTDSAVLLTEIKKTYLNFVTTLMTTGLSAVFYGPRNKPRLELFVNSIISIATTGRDRAVQKQAFGFLERTVVLWATDPEISASDTAFLTEIATKNIYAGNVEKKLNGSSSNGSLTPTGAQAVPGYQALVYDAVLPAAFTLIMSKSFRLKDGQSGMVLGEIASLMRTLITVRKHEAVTFLSTQFFPSRNCPPEATEHIVTRLRSEDLKAFRKTFADFVKDWRMQLGIDTTVLT